MPALPVVTTPEGMAAATNAEFDRRLREIERDTSLHQFVFARYVRPNSAGNQTVPVNTTQTVDWTDREYDTHNIATPGAFFDSFTMPLDGLYDIRVGMWVGTGGTPNTATLSVYKDSSARGIVALPIDQDQGNYPTGIASDWLRLAVVYPLRAGDIIYARLGAGAGGSAAITPLSPTGGGVNPFIEISRVGLIPPNSIVY